MMFRSFVVVLVLAVTCGFANATPISVGQGVNSANVYIEWAGGNIAEFVVNFGQSPTDTVKGIQLLNTIEQSTTLITVQYSGGFLDGITFNGNSNIGYGGGENWWHYWVNDGQGWDCPWTYGAGAREVGNGDSDGWIYGRDGAPVPEPLSVALLGLGSMFVAVRRK